MFLSLNIRQGAAKAAEAVAHRMLRRRRVVRLLIVAQKRERHQKPPGGIQKKRQRHGGLHGKTQTFIHQHQDKRKHKGNAASDISPGIALRRNIVHFLRRGDIHQHGIVKYQTGIKADLCDDEDSQKQNPGGRQRERGTADHAEHHTDGKERFLVVACVGDSAEHRAEHGYHNRRNRSGISPVSEIIHLRNTGILRQRVKINRKNRRHQHDKGGISDVVENPVLF